MERLHSEQPVSLTPGASGGHESNDLPDPVSSVPLALPEVLWVGEAQVGRSLAWELLDL